MKESYSYYNNYNNSLHNNNNKNNKTTILKVFYLHLLFSIVSLSSTTRAFQTPIASLQHFSSLRRVQAQLHSKNNSLLFLSKMKDTTTQTEKKTSSSSRWNIFSRETNPHDLLILNNNKDSSFFWSKDQYKESLDLYDSLLECGDTYISPHIKSALHCLESAYRLYGPNQMIGSYNGGKDAVVIMHLQRAAHANYYRTLQKDITEKMVMVPPRFIYFENKDEFPEVLSLLHETVNQYDLDMIAFDTTFKFSQGLEILVDTYKSNSNSNNNQLAFVLGTRKDDPNAGNQGQFAPSSSYMPPFMRVNPILDWSYGHVWHFLRLFHLPYCVLYDEGYTSLGTVKDTKPCPALERPQGGFWPAFMLRDFDQERAGRVNNKKQKEKTKASTNNNLNIGKTMTSSPSTVQLKEELRTSSTSLPPAQLGSFTNNNNNNNSNENNVPSKIEFENLDDNSLANYSILSNNNNNNNTNNKNNNNEQTTKKTKTTVGLIIIGDEILKGRCSDTNTNAAAIALREANGNVPLTRVSICSDDHDQIVSEIHKMHRLVDVIVTSGGVGPTHDDVTIKSISTALSSPSQINLEMAQFLLKKMNNEDKETTQDEDDDEQNILSQLSEAQIKMSTLPQKSKLRYLAGPEEWPILQCGKIFVLPGVPQFFQKKIELVASYLSKKTTSASEDSSYYKVVLQMDEHLIVRELNTVVQNHPFVTFGSYPFYFDSNNKKKDASNTAATAPTSKTVITIEANESATNPNNNSNDDDDGYGFGMDNEDENDKQQQQEEKVFFSKEEMDLHVELALADLLKELPDGCVLRVDNDETLAI